MNEVKNEIKEDEVDILELFGILFRYRHIIIAITLIAAISVVGFSILSLKLPPEKSPLPNIYKAQAIILIQHEGENGFSTIASSGIGSLASLSGVSTGKSYGELGIKLLKSKSILDKVIQDFNLIERYEIKKYLRTESRKAILQNSKFEYDEKTYTLTITFEDYDPVLAAQVVNRLVEYLDQRFSTIGGNRNLRRKSLLEDKLADVSAEMSNLETRIRKFQEKHGVLTIEELATEQITVLAKLRSQLILKEVEIKTYSDFSKIEDPLLKRLKSERENLLRLVREVEEGYSSYEEVMPPQKELPELALEFARIKRDLIVQEKIYQTLTQQYELAKLSLETEELIFQVLELAEVPDKKSGPSRSVICILTVFITFILSIMIALILNAIENIKKDPDKLRKLKGIRG